MRTNTMVVTGFQAAFLIFALHFFVMLPTKYLSERIGWPSEHYTLLGNAILFAIELLVVFAITPLRHFVLNQFQPMSWHTGAEAIATGILKIPGLLAVIGAFALWHITIAGSPDVFSAMGMIEDPSRAEKYHYSIHGIATTVLLSILLGPIVEEIVFRGVLFRAWERQWGWVPAMFATAVAFGLCHPSSIISAAIGSIVYTCLLRRTGTLWAPIAAHALYNLLVSWSLLGHVMLLRSREGANEIDAWAIDVIALAFVSIALPAYIWLAHKRPAPNEA